MVVDVKKILQGNHLAGARLIRILEEGEPEGIEKLKLLYPYTGNAFIIGVTGPPGSGKSTLVSGIITEFRRRNFKVGVVAVDPSSPISGGALLGDRIRMHRHLEDRGVFIRSMATRGHLGGLSRTTRETVLVLDAMGFEVVVIETVGVGQDEVEIAEFAHTTAIVSLPGMGDDIQTMKAGLLEVGNIFIVNKADAPGADELVEQLRAMLEMSLKCDTSWQPPILKTVAVKNEGIADLVDAFCRHRQFLIDSGRFYEHNFKQEFRFFRHLVKEMAADRIFGSVNDSLPYRDLLEELKKRKIDPFSAAEQLLNGVVSGIKI
jgi:LAO/AO transport system kinase